VAIVEEDLFACEIVGDLEAVIRAKIPAAQLNTRPH
jgi:hypothetical protein